MKHASLYSQGQRFLATLLLFSLLLQSCGYSNCKLYSGSPTPEEQPGEGTSEASGAMNQVTEDGTALLKAISEKKEAAAVELIKNATDATLKETRAPYYLGLAAEKGLLEVVELLLKKGAAIDAQDEYEHPPLHWAARGGHPEVVELLLKKGASTSLEDEYGRTALKLAEVEKINTEGEKIEIYQQVIDLIKRKETGILGRLLPCCCCGQQSDGEEESKPLL